MQVRRYTCITNDYLVYLYSSKLLIDKAIRDKVYNEGLGLVRQVRVDRDVDAYIRRFIELTGKDVYKVRTKEI